MSTKTRVVVGLSGGVDSAVSAKLLVDQGYDVIGVFMKNWDDSDDPHCPAAIDAIDARNVAAKLGIPFYTVNFAKEYWDDVFTYFLDQHKKYRTPNPDILCNKYVKFKAFLSHAQKLGAEYIATGHYAKKQRSTTNDQRSSKESFVDNRSVDSWKLAIPQDQAKDQTYFLYTLTQDQLRKTLFPLQDLKKSEVRRLAQEAGFENADKKDSTGICFVGERDYMTFLKQYLPEEPGDIVTERGEIVGQHSGLSFYTLGQRKNLNIGGIKGYQELPWVVIQKCVEENKLIIGQDPNHPRLFSDQLTATKLTWISGQAPALSFRGLCKIRYRQEMQPCVVELKDDVANVSFSESQRAITPGQSIVFYDERGKICLGGGEIEA